ncbi:MAG TPA: ABC transporter ATP-binding protein [Mycobacteriales bacterium]|nr:ABC transporter ATP-binding protein [Mycobacteriales bacterium]
MTGPSGTQPAIVVDDVGIKFAVNRRRRLELKNLFIEGASAAGLVDYWALRHVSFSIAHGEAVGVIGKNGCGKSTLLRLVAGVMLPDEGQITVNGGVGAMIELSAGFVKDLTARDNVYLISSLHGFTREETDARFDRIIRWAGVQEFVDTPVGHFSSGMKARLAFSIVTRMEEPILLVDEVLAVGDKAFRRKCNRVIDRMLGAGRTLLLVSHNEADLRRFCKRGIYLRRGEPMVDGPLDDVLDMYLADDEEEEEDLAADGG